MATAQIGRTGYQGGGVDPMLYDAVQRGKQRAHAEAMQARALSAQGARQTQQGVQQKAQQTSQQEHATTMQSQALGAEKTQQTSRQEHEVGMQAESLQAQREIQAADLRARESDRELKKIMQERDQKFNTYFQERAFRRRDQIEAGARVDLLTEKQDTLELDAINRQLAEADAERDMTMMATLMEEGRLDTLKREQLRQGMEVQKDGHRLRVNERDRADELLTLYLASKPLEEVPVEAYTLNADTLSDPIDQIMGGLVRQLASNKYSYKQLREFSSQPDKMAKMIDEGALTVTDLVHIGLITDKATRFLGTAEKVEDPGVERRIAIEYARVSDIKAGIGSLRYGEYSNKVKQTIKQAQETVTGVNWAELQKEQRVEAGLFDLNEGGFLKIVEDVLALPDNPLLIKGREDIKSRLATRLEEAKAHQTSLGDTPLGDMQDALGGETVGQMPGEITPLGRRSSGPLARRRR